MKDHWLFLVKDNNVQRQLDGNNPIVIIEISTKKNLAVDQGDDILFVTNKGLFISHRGIIKSKDEGIEFSIKDEQLRLFQFEIDIVEKIEDPFSISLFAYSLVRIYKHYEEPQRHFRKGFNRLKNSDYDTITTKQVFISRTAFGKICNSLHMVHRKEFLKKLIDENPEVFTKGNDFVTAFRELKIYIEVNILTHAEMMRETRDELVQLNVQELPRIRFEEDGRGDLIVDQVDIIDNLFTDEDLGDPTLFLKTVEANVLQVVENEIKLSKLFEGRTLPIVLI